MKFLRHLTAVVLAVAVIVGLGMLWAHASGGGAGIGGDVRRAPPAGVIRVRPDNGLHLANTGNLIQTCEIEAVLAAVVITASAVRRRHHRARR